MPMTTRPQEARVVREGSAANDPLLGATFAGRYTIRRLLARGGVGVVYLAQQRDPDRDVVVKVLAPNWIDNAEAVARFEREGQRLNALKHPNIVGLYECGRENDVAYLAMEHLDGEPLSDYLTRKGGRLRIEDFVPIAAQILKGLGYAHSRGLMHRDIKPSNIMLCVRKGRANFVKILDFGMAKLVDDERDITSEQIVGTANYLSPEQIRGEAIDARVDVYAIGVMFYMLLAARLPFIADNNAALLYKHVHEPPSPLAEHLPAGHDIPQGLIALVHRCLAKAVADRPMDANAVVAELVACVPGELFHLPVAQGGTATASSSYAVLPAGVEAGPDDLSGRLTRPVQSLRAAQTGKAATTDREAAPTTPITGAIASTGRARTANRLPRMRPATLPPIVRAPPTPPAEGGKLWLVLASIVTLALLGLGGWLVSQAGRTTDASQGPAVPDERRLAARLEQVELDLLGGELGRARAGLDAAEPSFAGIPRLRSRADLLRRRLDVETKLAAARTLEQEGKTAEALSGYRDALTLDPNHAGAREALVRLSAPAITPTPARPSRPRGDRPGETRRVERPVEGPTEVLAPAKPEDDGLLGDGKQDDAVFLPDGH